MMILIDRGEGVYPNRSRIPFREIVSRTRKPPAPPDAALNFGQKSSCILPAPCVSQRASTSTSRIATGAARARGSRHSRAALCGHGEHAELRAQLLALAFRALRLVAAEDQGFKLVLALLANVFKNRHDHRSRATDCSY